MICHPRKCIFVHIPKTAGQSIEQCFLDLHDIGWTERSAFLLERNTDPAKGPPRLAYLKANQYVAGGHISIDLFKSYYKFSFVRNPWDRLVSEYKSHYDRLKVEFKKYVMEQQSEPEWSNSYTHIIPQKEFLYDEAGRLMVDFVGRFEDLQNDFDEICRQINVLETRLPFRNKSTLPKFKKLNKRHYTEFYDDESKAFVENRYHEDIKTFHYTFDD